MIELKNVSKMFIKDGVKFEALKNINLSVEKGDILGVIGYSGAGKSTLIRMINGLEKPTEGEVFVFDEEIKGLSKKRLREERKRIGMIFQHFNLLESKTVFQNVAIPLILKKENKDKIKNKVEELLEFVGLSDKGKNFPKELSGGQKQRVAIARALASDPEILLCDEATSALDPETTDQILQLLKRINKEYNITICIITHEMHVIQTVCNKVAVMEKGEIIEQGRLKEIFSNPQNPTTAKFIQTVIKEATPENIKESLGNKIQTEIYRKFDGSACN